MATVADAALVTGLSMTALGAVAYNAPSEQFLNWAGPLSFACMGSVINHCRSIENSALNKRCMFCC